jgi:hypothetical protein
MATQQITDTKILCWTVPLVVLMCAARAYVGDPWTLIGVKACFCLFMCSVVALWCRG